MGRQGQSGHNISGSPVNPFSRTSLPSPDRPAWIEPGQLQFIRQNFGEILSRADAATWLNQIHRWLFIERKPLAVVRQKLAAVSHRARVVAITSGKGGVGKTTCTVNLAVSLARLGWRVLVFDADLGMANTHIFAGVQPQRTLLTVLEHRLPLAEAVTPGPEP